MISHVFLLCLMASISSMASTIQSSSPPSEESKTYIVHMDETKMATLQSSLAGSKKWHEAVFDSILELSAQEAREEEGEASSPQLLYAYNTVLSGFSAKLSPKQASSLEKIDGFLYSFPDVLLNLHTTHTPQFLGLKPGAGLWSQSSMASDVIIGVIDSGIWPEHESFQGNHFSPIPKNWKGKCEAGTNFSSNNCNRKLIGATAFWKGYEASGGFINETTEFKSVRDSEGHGTHTASTAAGNLISGASLFGNAKGSMTGMRYTARVAAYKACWSTGCANSDVLAAVDRAVADGVNVLSLSLGGGPQDYYADSIAIATFGAIQKGVFVSCSGGNSGPSAFTVSNAAPWITTVAASYIDRSFPTLVTLGDGRTFKGASLYVGKPTKQLPLVYGSNAGGEDAEYCQSGTLTRKLVQGKMVLCDRGFNGRAEKGENVKFNGGLAMLLLNSEDDGEELLADAHVLPGSSLGATASAAIKKYISSSKNPTAMIKFLGTVYGDPAPISAAFSSRGPNIMSEDIIKPDVTAPGMNILAAWPPSLSPTLLASDKRHVSFNIISGTSMSCPHVSGLAALLKSVHFNWSPAAIKSALMTTAYTVNNRNSSIIDISSGSPATPFDFGSGHVDPERASNPGLVYDITPNNYLEYLCSLNYTSKQMSAFARRTYRCSKRSVRPAAQLNYPSFSVLLSSDKPNSVSTHTRIVTNVGAARCKYTVQVRQPNKVTVNVVPKVLDFSKIGQKLSYKVTFVGNGRKGQSGYSFGHLIWTCNEFTVRSPIAVAWQ